MPEIAVMTDLEDEFSILVNTTQEEDRLFSNDDFQKSVPKFDSKHKKKDKPMMVVVKQQVRRKSKSKSEGDFKREAKI